MSRDGHETPSIKERLKAKSATDLRELEGLILKEQARLARSLRQSSKDALTTIASSTDAQIKEIEETVRMHHSRMIGMLNEIEIRPQRTLRTIMITSAVTGAIMGMIPWVIISYLGMSATETAETWLDRRAGISTEEMRLNTLEGITLIEAKTGETVLMLPKGTTEILQCGTPEDRTPCILIGE